MSAARTELFGAWAADYDRLLTGARGFPFAGYEDVLAEIVTRAQVEEKTSVLDIGTGTGNLAARFLARGVQCISLRLRARNAG